MNITDIVLPKTIRKAKRVGRGYGSKKGGHTSTRGQKGQKSRSGYKAPRPGFEGGSMPLSRRIAKKKGFDRGYFKARMEYFILNLSDLNIFDNDTIVTPEVLFEKGLIQVSTNKYCIVKLLNNGKLDKKLKVSGILVSKGAEKTIVSLGGEVE